MKYKTMIGIVLLVIVAGIPSVYYFRQYQKAQYQLNNPTEVAKQDVKDTLRAVGKLIMLPDGEEPTVMQVTDVTKLKDQPFFARSMNGDKVLIYTQAKKAILYRPATNKIIDVAPVNIGGNASSSAQISPTPPATLQLATPSGTPNVRGQ